MTSGVNAINVIAAVVVLVIGIVTDLGVVVVVVVVVVTVIIIFNIGLVAFIIGWYNSIAVDIILSMTWFRFPPIYFQLQEIIEEERIGSINSIITVDTIRDVIITCSYGCHHHY